MTNYEYIQKTSDIEAVGKYICKAVELQFGEDVWACDLCPMAEKCRVNHNGWTVWLMEEHKGNDFVSEND